MTTDDMLERTGRDKVPRIKAKQLGVGQYIWYMMQWRELLSVSTYQDLQLPGYMIRVRFRGDAADPVDLNPDDIYEVRGLVE
ncbi:MAG: hypothetical protein AB7L09_22070 [Nitrospira sp.]